jgi:putative glutamine amidotransferase
MTPPVIGITVGQIQNKNRFYNRVPSAYAEAIVQAGGLPLLIPLEIPLEGIPDLFKRLDGLLLSGGGDIDIHAFGGKPHPSIFDVSEIRDHLEFALLKHALQAHKPVLGICRGIQVINVALGGTLYTHIPDQFKTQLCHSTPDEKGRDFLAHEINLEPDSKLGRIIGQTQFSVNSFHHQAIQKPAADLVVTAHASDGLIEAVELSGDAFNLVGVQWHPECLLEHEIQVKLFKAFVAAC